MELRSGHVVGQNVLPLDRRPVFEEGVRQVFLRWTALRLAVENEWGGASSAEKAQLLMGDVLEWFYRKKDHYADELEEELDDAISQDFNVQAEDGSPRQVAEALVSVYQECVQGNFSTVERMQRETPSGFSKSQREAGDGITMEDDASSSEDGDDGGEGGDAMEEDGGQAPAAVPLQPPEPAGPVVDEEGFTLVQGKGRKGGRR